MALTAGAGYAGCRTIPYQQRWEICGNAHTVVSEYVHLRKSTFDGKSRTS